MKTNEVEKLTGISKQTILYYEKEGLLQVAREENGYRNYSQTDVQRLQIIKFLRNLNVNIDDIRLVLNGALSLQQCMKVQSEFIDAQMDELVSLQKNVKQLRKRSIPLLPQMEELETIDEQTFVRVLRANNHVAIGRRAVPKLVIGRVKIFLREMILLSILGYFSYYIVTGSFLSFYYYIPFMLLVIFIMSLIFIRFGTEGNNPYLNMTFLFNLNEPFIEFVEDHVIYQKERTLVQNMLYLMDVLRNRGGRWLKCASYKEIKNVKIIVKRRYLNATGGMIAYPIAIPCFIFDFQNGDHFYIEAISMLDDDAKWVAKILKGKKIMIEDTSEVLTAWETGVNLNDFLKGRKSSLDSYI